MNEIDFQHTGLHPDTWFDFDKVNNFYIHNIENNTRILEISHNIKEKYRHLLCHRRGKF